MFPEGNVLSASIRNAQVKLWTTTVLACLAALVAAAFLWPRSLPGPLTALSDIVQCLLLTSGTIAFLLRASGARGRMRLFWSLMTLGLALWLSYQFLWTYIEVYRRAEVPDIFSGDIIIFIHIVPFIAALALRPHLPRDQYSARLGQLDFALLVYLVDLSLRVAGDGLAIRNSRSGSLQQQPERRLSGRKNLFPRRAGFLLGAKQSPWRTFYANLFKAASFLYSASSYIANWAISRSVYYSGSLYDIPLVASMAWITLVGLWNQMDEPETQTARTSTTYGVWVARCGMIAAFFASAVRRVGVMGHRIAPAGPHLPHHTDVDGGLPAMGAMVLIRQRLLGPPAQSSADRLSRIVREPSNGFRRKSWAVGKDGFHRPIGRRSGPRTQQPDHRHARLFRFAAQHETHPGTTNASQSNQPEHAPNQVSGGQPANAFPLRRAPTTKFISSLILEYFGTHRSNVDRTPVAIPEDRSHRRSRPESPRLMGRFQSASSVCFCRFWAIRCTPSTSVA